MALMRLDWKRLHILDIALGSVGEKSPIRGSHTDRYMQSILQCNIAPSYIKPSIQT